MAEKPEMVWKIFKQNQVQEDGKYLITLYLGGTEMEVVVDHMFPYNEISQRPAFS